MPPGALTPLLNDVLQIPSIVVSPPIEQSLLSGYRTQQGPGTQFQILWDKTFAITNSGSSEAQMIDVFITKKYRKFVEYSFPGTASPVGNTGTNQLYLSYFCTAANAVNGVFYTRLKFKDQ